MQKTYAVTNNRVEVRGRLIVIRVVGDQTEDTIIGIRQKLAELLGEFFGPKQIMVDITRIGQIERSAFRQAGEFLHNQPFKCIAVFGAKPGIMPIVNKYLRHSMDEVQIRFFADEASARDWLGT